MKFLFFLFFAASLFSSENELLKRVYSHLLIHDYIAAQEECSHGLSLYPDSEKLQKIYIKTLAQGGRDEEAIHFSKRLKLEEPDSDLIETLAWGVIRKSEYSSQFMVSLASLMSAYYTDDVRATELLLHQLSSSNAILRSIAAQLSPRYRDGRVIEMLKAMLQAEKIWFVRLEVIKALGAMEVKEVKETLTHLITHPRTTAEEKGAAIASLVNIYDDVGEKELSNLIDSKRAGLRHLACQIISHLDLKEWGTSVEKLLNDPVPDVRIAALNTLSFLGLKNQSPKILSSIIDLTEDTHASVALTAAWIVSRFAPQTALQVVKKWVYSTDEASRRLGAYVLGRIGACGQNLSHEVLKISPDPFVKANLALGAIGQGANMTRLSDVLYTFLLLRKGKIMWDQSQNPLFQVLAPSKICHIPQVAQYPSMVDHLTRLEILGTLAVLNHPKAEEAMKQFLREEGYGVSFSASNMLIEEGGEETFDILRELLHDKEDHIRIQAALVLALTGGEPEAIEVLQEAYFLVDRDMKINILGALGHIGDKASIPFLMQLLEEPHQTLKVMAASALIQCVYH